MVYINSDGSIGEKPWHKNIRGIFWGCLNFIIAFFQTLISPGWSNNGNQYLSSQRWDGGSGGGGNGGNGKPKWRPGRFGGQCRTISSLHSTMPSGG